MMTRKDYQMIANVFKMTRPDCVDIPIVGTKGSAKLGESNQWERDVNALADALKIANWRFDRARFIAEFD